MARIALIAFLTAVLQAAQPRPATIQGHVVRAGDGEQGQGEREDRIDRFDTGRRSMGGARRV
jgi:hypothetical protein